MAKIKKEHPLVMFMGIGFEALALIGGATILGSHLDEIWDGRGIYTILLMILALMAWMIHMFFLVRLLNKRINNPKNPNEDL